MLARVSRQEATYYSKLPVIIFKLSVRHHQNINHQFLGRKGFYLSAVPVGMQGIGGAGAPHVFKLQRVRDTGIVGCSN